MPGPRAVQNLQMPQICKCPTGNYKACKYPAEARGAWAPVELTDALFNNINFAFGE